MRSLLIEATLNCLQEYGYHGVSVSRILEKVGVSKGAWSHHFSTKKELIAAAVESQLQWAVSTGRAALPSITNYPEEKQLEVIIDYFWENFEQGRRRDVWVEVYVASRTDSELRELLKPIINKFQESLNEVWHEYFELKVPSGSSIEEVMNLTLFVTRGMAIQSLFMEDPEYYEAFKAQWVRLLGPLVRLKG